MEGTNDKGKLVWFAIVLLVVVALVFVSINNKNNTAQEDEGAVNEGTLTEDSSLGVVEEEQFMDMNQEGVISLVDGAVRYQVLQEGQGEEAAYPGDTISVNYTGRLLDGTTFDSNVDKKFNHVEPLSFTINGGMVIPGWDLGTTGMKVGEKRLVTIEPEYAYGEQGRAPVIPPNATLVFEIELLAITKN